MRRSIFHGVLGTLGTLLIVIFLSTTIVSALFLTQDATVLVKYAIAHYGIYALIIFMMLTGISGNFLGNGSKGPLIIQKRKRMIIIAVNGLLIMIPSALFLSFKASNGAFDLSFYVVQLIEIAVGFFQLFLMGKNFREGVRLAKYRLHKAACI